MIQQIRKLIKRGIDTLFSAEANRQWERSRPIEVLVRIPYTVGNEVALRGLTVRDLTVTLPVALERVEVRCVGNPDWRK